jgi:glycosyltransferase involved in cell wall biosynthesis
MKFSYSVVIPYGKIEGNFLRCINSTLQQIVNPEEIFVICNGQITACHIKELLSKEKHLLCSKIKFLYPKNCTNANIARNFGLQQVKSEWVAFLDSDDWWDNNWSELSKLRIESEDCDFLYGSIKIHGENNSYSELSCCDYQKLGTAENYLLAYRPAQTSTYFIRSNLARRVGWNNELRRHQDYDFFVRAVNFGLKVSIINGAGVNVDWSIPRHHKFHRDCLYVVKNWRSNVEKKFYLRHLNNLRKSAFQSKDWIAFLLILANLIISLFLIKGYLINVENIND